jgi:predicted nucleic acid-binding protein
MILVDTSVWIQHLRKGSERLMSLLYNEEVLSHPFVLGELACGSLQNREKILQLIESLPQAHIVEHEDVMRFLDAEELYGRGLGWIDVHLLASTLLSGSTIWTLDKKLQDIASKLGISA